MADEIQTAEPEGTPPAQPSWRDTLPEDIRADKSLESFKDIGALAKSYIETKKLVGAKSAVPGEKATPEEHTAFRKALGVPDAPEGYRVKRPDVTLDGAWDEAAEKAFFGVAHKAGMTPQQVQAALDWYGQFERAKLEQARAEANSIGTALRTEWGPNYDAKLGRANRAIQEIGGDALVDHYATNGMGRDPLTIKAWAAVGDALVEAGTITGEGVHGVSPDEARERIAELNAELKKLPDGSPRALDMINEIVALTNAMQRGR